MNGSKVYVRGPILVDVLGYPLSTDDVGLHIESYAAANNHAAAESFTVPAITESMRALPRAPAPRWAAVYVSRYVEPGEMREQDGCLFFGYRAWEEFIKQVPEAQSGAPQLFGVAVYDDRCSNGPGISQEELDRTLLDRRLEGMFR